MVTLNKFHTEDPQILGTTIQNLFAQVSWHTGFVYPCPKMYLQPYGVQWLVACEELKASTLHLVSIEGLILACPSVNVKNVTCIWEV
jgi:hypothetical protein